MMGERNFILCVIVLSILTRLMLAPLYVSPPDQAYSIEPHDFPKYMADAATILEGRILYVDITHTDNTPSPYGPLLVLSWAAWVKVFGTDYTLFKIPSVIYDTLTVILIFYVTKSLFNVVAAKYASLFYAFSFIPLLISGADASSDVPLVFFLLFSVYLLIKSKPNIKLSSFFLGVALLFKLVLGVIFIPLIFYYFLQQKKIRQGLIYLAIIILTISIVTFPFFLKAGLNVFVQLNYPAGHTITGTTLLSAVKMIVNYFTLGMANTYNYNPLIQQFALPFIILSLLGGGVYILKFGLKNKKIELIRNIFVLILLINIFGSAGYWHIFVWLIPYIIILFVYNQSFKKFRLSPSLIVGLVFVVASTIIYAVLYRETKIPEYSISEQSLLLLSAVLATVGTYLALNKFKLRTSWTLSTFSWAWWLTNHAELLMIFGFVVPIFRSIQWAYGIQDFTSVVLITISSLWLLVSVHKTTPKRGYVNSRIIKMLGL